MRKAFHPYAPLAFAVATLSLLEPLPAAAQSATATINLASFLNTAIEGRDVAARISLRRTGNTSSAVTVRFSTPVGEFDSATPGVDYVAASGTVAFAPGQTEQEFTITVLPDDVLFEGTEIAKVLLSEPSPGAALGELASGFLFIEDPTWPTLHDGSFALELEINNDVFALAQQPDGKILVAGAFSGFGDPWFDPWFSPTRLSGGVARLHSDGSIDTGFDPGAGANDTVYAVAFQANGQVLIGGSFTSVAGTPRAFLARLNANGSLDTTFAPTLDDEMRAIAVQPDGRIVIGGRFIQVNGQSRGRIARLNPDGSLDPTFNPGTGADDHVRTLALQADGRVVLGGDFSSVNGITAGFFARLNSDGSPDTSFVAGPGANDEVRSVAVQPDGKVLLGGEFDNVHGIDRKRIVRLNTDGSVDLDFNPGIDLSGVVRGLTIEPDGKILFGGGFLSLSGPRRQNIARLNSDGSLDSQFLGRSFYPENGAFNDEIFAMVVQPNGSIVVGGQFYRTNDVTRTALDRIHGSSTMTSFAMNSTYTGGSETNSEANASIVFSVRRQGDLSGGASVDFETVGVTAIPGQDVEATAGTLTFGPGEFLKDVTVALINDDRREFTEQFRLRLHNPSFGSGLGLPVATLAYIWDNDTGFNFTSSDYAVNERTNEVVIFVTRGPAPVGEATVDFRTEDGTAQAGLDYMATNGTLHFAVGEKQKSFLVRILNDNIAEGGESFLLRLVNPTGSTDLGFQPQLTLAIQDAASILTFQSPSETVNEADRYVQALVWRLSSGQGTISVKYSTQDGSARAGLDYVATTGTLSFNEGELAKGIYIPILDDNLPELKETFRVVLSEPSPGAGIISPGTNVVTINSNDRGIQFGSTNLVVAETGFNLVIAVIRDSSEFGPASVDYVITPRTAMPGLDYIDTSGTVAFDESESVKAITIPILDDCIAEPNQTFSIQLENPSRGTVLGPDASATATILDNDDPNRRLEFLSFARTPTGSMHLSLSTPGGFAYVLEASADLRTWQPLATNSVTQCMLEFNDTAALLNRFYRARRLTPP